MRGGIRGAGRSRVLAAGLAVGLGAVLAGLLGAGCSASAVSSSGGGEQTCFAFAVRALEKHITVTRVPTACAGLSNAAVNLAVARAVREVVGPQPRADVRRLDARAGQRLSELVRAVPAAGPGRPARPVTLTAQRASDVPLSLAALAAWVITAAAGSYLLAGWLRHGGLRQVRWCGQSAGRGRSRAREGGMPAGVILGHFLLAASGLGLWIGFLASDVTALAWIAAGLLLPTAGLGMATLVTALPEPAGMVPPAMVPTGAVPPGMVPPASKSPAMGPGGAGAALATRIAAPAGPARVRLPVTVIVVHGVLATATMLLVLLAAIGAG